MGNFLYQVGATAVAMGVIGLIWLLVMWLEDWLKRDKD